MTAVRGAVHQTFSSLRIRNFRLYFTAQLISVSGTWMQSVAQAWLVLHLTGSGVALGIVVGLQFLPMLVFGPFGGLVADRVNKRRLLYVTQTCGGLLALVLGILVVSHTVVLWEVYALATVLGVVNLFDNPARQTFMIEMVGRDDLPNAISLNSVVMNASRVVGPAIGGVIITLFGLGICFFVNAASYVAVLIGLSMMRTSELHPTGPCPGPRGRSATGSATCGGRLRCATSSWPSPSSGSSPTTSPSPSPSWPRTPSTAGPGRTRSSPRAWGPAPSSAVSWPPTGPDPPRASCRCWPSCSAASWPPWPWRRPCWRPTSSSCSWGRHPSASSPRPTPRCSSSRSPRCAAGSWPSTPWPSSGPPRSAHPWSGAIAQWTSPRIALLTGAVATVLSAGLLMWRHQARLRAAAGVDEAEIHLLEVEAVEDAESRVG